MNTLADRIRWAMAQASLSQAELARKVGLKQPSIHGWLSGKAKFLKGENLLAAAAALGVDADWLATGAGSPTPRSLGPQQEAPQKPPLAPIRAYDVEAIEDGDPTPDGFEQIEHIDFALSAGSGSVVPHFVETKFPLYYRMNWFQQHRAKPQNVKSMSVRGDSMQFTLYDRDRVAVHIADKVVTSNSVFALIIDGEACVKRLFRHGNGLRIVSDNPDKARYPDTIIEAEELADRVSIIGRVIDKSGAGGL